MPKSSTPQDLFFQLTPDIVLNSVEACGRPTTGEYMQLNSYENRVYSLRKRVPKPNKLSLSSIDPVAGQKRRFARSMRSYSN